MTETSLDRLARRASTDSSFLDHQLAAFARARGFDDDALASFLGCPVATLTNVRLCGAIRPEHRRADLMAVAAKFGLSVPALADATKPLPEPRRDGAVADGAPGVVLAARDRSDAP